MSEKKKEIILKFLLCRFIIIIIIRWKNHISVESYHYLIW